MMAAGKGAWGRAMGADARRVLEAQAEDAGTSPWKAYALDCFFTASPDRSADFRGSDRFMEGVDWALRNCAPDREEWEEVSARLADMGIAADRRAFTRILRVLAEVRLESGSAA